MTITFPLDPPAAPTPTEMKVTIREVVAQSRSPFSYKRQVQEHQGGHWEMSFDLPPLTEAEWREWTGWLAALRGVRGTFLWGDPARTSPQGAGGGTPVVNGAAQTGLVLATDGWPVSTLVLKRGDYFQLGNGSATRLHMVTADATTDSGGAVDLDIWPRLRESPADGALLTIDNPVGQWQLATNQNAWRHIEARQVNLSLDFKEAI